MAELADKIRNISPNSQVNLASSVQDDALAKIIESMDILNNEFQMVRTEISDFKQFNNYKSFNCYRPLRSLFNLAHRLNTFALDRVSSQNACCNRSLNIYLNHF